MIPAFEIIATVAEAHAGPDGSYSYESPLSLLRPWVQRATAAGMYVVLDLQRPGQSARPGQAVQIAAQAAQRRAGPGPGVEAGPTAAAAETDRQRERHRGQCGQPLAGRLTARAHLPQKLLVLHQFQLSMLANERRLDTRHGDLAIVIHMDGQGTPHSKQKTWNAVTGAAPPDVFFGWKNFYTKDHPMLGPRQTMARTPEPVMISYQ